MDLDLHGKRALVCGSTQGIGRASALELAMLGASVTLMARDETKLKNVMAEMTAGPGQLHGYLVGDFDDAGKVKKVIESFAANNDVDILVNNTGGPPAGQAIDAQPEDFLNAFTSHLLCSQVLTQAVIPGMKRKGFGRIINIISTSVKIPIRGLGVSNTIRGAVANWSKTLSLELGSFGITVNNVLPGSTLTGRLEFVIRHTAEKTGKTTDEIRNRMITEIPAGRLAEPREVAAAVAFLATPAAGYINGVNIPVDGGRTGSL